MQGGRKCRQSRENVCVRGRQHDRQREKVCVREGKSTMGQM